jgi:hypothetical protein
VPLPRDDDTTSTDLKVLQEDRARDADQQARAAQDGAEARSHRRRADKAAYLRDKLAEAERADAQRRG